MKSALLFTVISDLFLLLLDHYFWGVTTFIIVQQLYSLRLILVESKTREKDSVYDKQYSADRIMKINDKIFEKYGLRLLLQVILSGLIYIILNKMGVKLDELLLVSVFYFVCISSNAVSAVKSTVRNPNDRANLLYAIGMVLFLLCDINVGIFNLSGFITLPEHLCHTLYSLSSILMWTFYAPAQVLISLSVTKMNFKANSVKNQSI
jgi:YhhN-like protein.